MKKLMTAMIAASLFGCATVSPNTMDAAAEHDENVKFGLTVAGFAAAAAVVVKWIALF